MGSGTPLGRVRGLGSSKHGTHHWLMQRMTAIGNVLLGSWLFVSLLTLNVTDHKAMAAWVANPLVAAALIGFVISVFWHVRLGLQVLIEDYVHADASRVFAIVLLNLAVVGGALFSIVSIVRLALGGAA